MKNKCCLKLLIISYHVFAYRKPNEYVAKHNVCTQSLDGKYSNHFFDESLISFNEKTKKLNDESELENENNDDKLFKFNRNFRYEDLIEYQYCHKSNINGIETEKAKLRYYFTSTDKSDIDKFDNTLKKCGLLSTLNRNTFQNDLILLCIHTIEQINGQKQFLPIQEQTNVSYSQLLYTKIQLATNMLFSYIKKTTYVIKNIFNCMFGFQNKKYIINAPVPNTYKRAADLYVKTCNLIADLMELQVYNINVCIIIKGLPDFVYYSYRNNEHDCIKYFPQWVFRQNFSIVDKANRVHFKFYYDVMSDLNNETKHVNDLALKNMLKNETIIYNIKFMECLVKLKAIQDRRERSVIWKSTLFDRPTIFKKTLISNQTKLLERNSSNKFPYLEKSKACTIFKKDNIVNETLLQNKLANQSELVSNGIDDCKGTNDNNANDENAINNIADTYMSQYNENFEDLNRKYQQLKIQANNHEKYDAKVELTELFTHIIDLNNLIQTQQTSCDQKSNVIDDVIDNTIKTIEKVYKKSDDPTKLFNHYLGMFINNTTKKEKLLNTLKLEQNLKRKKQIIQILVKNLICTGNYFKYVKTIITMQSECNDIITHTLKIMKANLASKFKDTRKNFCLELNLMGNNEIKAACLDYITYEGFSCINLLDEVFPNYYQQTYNDIAQCYIDHQLIILYELYLIYYTIT